MSRLHHESCRTVCIGILEVVYEVLSFALQVRLKVASVRCNIRQIVASGLVDSQSKCREPWLMSVLHFATCDCFPSYMINDTKPIMIRCSKQNIQSRAAPCVKFDIDKHNGFCSDVCMIVTTTHAIHIMTIGQVDRCMTARQSLTTQCNQVLNDRLAIRRIRMIWQT